MMETYARNLASEEKKYKRAKNKTAKDAEVL